MELKTFIARVAGGPIVPSATYYVYLADTLTLATIYDKDGIAIANPGSASASGQIAFAAADGDYDLRVTDGATLDNQIRVSFADTYRMVDLANDTDPAKGASLIGYSGRNVADRLGDVASVKDFLYTAATVKGAFLNAIDSLGVGGGTVFVPDGEYVLEWDTQKIATYLNVSVLIPSNVHIKLSPQAVIKTTGGYYSAFGSYQTTGAGIDGGRFEMGGARSESTVTVTATSSASFTVSDATWINVGQGVVAFSDGGTGYARIVTNVSGSVITLNSSVPGTLSSGVGKIASSNSAAIYAYECEGFSFGNHYAENGDIAFAAIDCTNVNHSGVFELGDFPAGRGDVGVYWLGNTNAVCGDVVARKIGRAARFSGANVAVGNIVSNATGITRFNSPLTSEAINGLHVASVTAVGGNNIAILDFAENFTIGSLVGANVTENSPAHSVALRGCEGGTIGAISINVGVGGQGGALSIQSSSDIDIDSVNGTESGGVLVLKNSGYSTDPKRIRIKSVSLNSASPKVDYAVRCKGSDCHFDRITGNNWSSAPYQNSTADSALYADSGKRNTYNGYAEIWADKTGTNYRPKIKARIQYNGSAWEVASTYSNCGIQSSDLVWTVDGSGGRLLIDVSDAAYAGLLPTVTVSPIETTGGTALWPKATMGSLGQVVVGFYDGAGTRVTTQSNLMQFSITIE